ncbi:hypothetical protein [Paraburkholderia graminis]|uniref:hypothetical protein n=1 Tax=Paraburkholderia graminis TaxID=60548 RepID=UPI0038BCE3FE
MSKAPIPPRHLTDTAVRAWHRIFATAVARGIWRAEFRVSLELTAVLCAAYIDGARALLSPDGPQGNDADRRELEEKRLLVRRLLVDYGVIAPERERLAGINEEGLDSDIEGVCALNPR